MKKHLDILMIGNSFSICVCNFLPQIVKSSDKHSINLTSMYIGGCSLERHYNNINETLVNPDARQYAIRNEGYENDIAPALDYASINEMLSMRKWDIVTIQQASHFSTSYDTYQPYADFIINFIREKAPSAEIVIQQTWAYRSDDNRLRPNGEWQIDQSMMDKKLTIAYETLRENTDFRMIPTGRAVRYSRINTPEEKRFVPYEVADLSNYTWPDFPKQASDVVGSLYWRKNEEEELYIAADTIHLNKRGEFLQACVWYGFLYGENPTEISYTPDFIGKKDSAFLKNCAKLAIDEELKSISKGNA